MSPLPVAAALEPLRAALAEPGAAVLCAPPGSGKTTRVPLALLDASWLEARSIVMLEPRRVAARAAARYMAACLGEAVGAQVGFRVRFESAVSSRTRVEVVTEGVLARRLQRDPDLSGVGLVIFDEFHERSLEADLALALTLDARRALRPDLRVLVMSATLDAAPVARLLGNAPVVETSGRPHPVAVHHAERAPAGPPAAAAAAAVLRALDEAPGDVLVFLPGAREIRAVEEQLRGRAPCPVLSLYGELPPEAQDRAIRADPDGRRRVVLATNIAETSLTIEGVRAVVDTGLARRPRFDPNSGLTRLVTVPVSRASAAQRAGRAGREGAGLALRLWTEAEHARRPPHDPPEILHADLAPLALELARWGVAAPGDLDWLDPPPPGAWRQAVDLLRSLGAVDGAGRITTAGRRMSALPAHPRLARMLAAAGGAPGIHLAADLAALLDGPDPLAGEGAGIDLRHRVEALRALREATPGTPPGGSRTLARARRVSAQLRRAAGAQTRDSAAGAQTRDSAAGARGSGDAAGVHRADTPVDVDAAGALLLAGFPDRVARRRPGGRGRFLLASGRGLTLESHDPLAASDWLVVPDLDAGAVEARAFRAAPVTLDAIRAVLAAAITRERRVAWNAREEAVEAVEEERLGALVLDARALPDPDPDAVAAAMLDGVQSMGLDALPFDGASRRLQARVESLRRWQPEAGWPAMDDAVLGQSLATWLAPYLAGMTRRQHLSRLDLEAALRALIPPALAGRLDEGAPVRLEVPGGSRVTLDYRPGGEPPVLAVKLQEMFGCIETPTVCWGRVPVQVHLLSPAGRPLHVTQDLASFWRNAYPQVRKEMRGRYPKHPWPEDPLSAAPTRHTRRPR